MMSRHEIYTYQTITNGNTILRVLREKKLSKPRLFKTCRSVYGEDGDLMARLVLHGDPFWIGVLQSAREVAQRHGAISEWTLGNLNNPTLFFERSSMVSDISRLRASNISSKHIVPEWKTFAVAAPRGSSIKGCKLSSFMVNIMTKKEFRDAANSMLSNMPEWQNEGFLNSDGLDDSSLYLFLSIKTKQKKGHCFFQCAWGDLFKDLALTDEEWESSMLHGNSEDTAHIRCHLRFVAALIVFMDMFPGRIQKGLPESAKISDTKMHGKKSVISKRATPLRLDWPIDNSTGKPVVLVGRHRRHYTHPSKCVRTNGKPWWGEVREHKRGANLTPYTVTDTQAKKSA